jgi:uncharacterized membrane protein
MAIVHQPIRGLRPVEPFHLALQSFPIACFSLTLLTDLAYIQTSNLLWLHFSEWLLLAGLVFGVAAILARFIDFLITRIRPRWSAVIAAVVVLVLATINSFAHTSDGWTAVVPLGIVLSCLTVLAMLVTGWFARHGVVHAGTYSNVHHAGVRHA